MADYNIDDRWFDIWVDDDGFNIKEGPRQDNIDLFFDDDERKPEADGKKACGKK